MAEINLNSDTPINTSLSEPSNISASVTTGVEINANISDINYIPGYEEAEKERRANEVVRQENEANRIALYEEMEYKKETDYYKGDKGDTGDTGIGLNYNWDNTKLGIKREDESVYTYTDLKGDKGDKGEPGAIKTQVVQELPSTGAEDTIYLVPITPDTSGNNYAEYMYINGAWELLGKIGIATDLTDYVQFTDYATKNKAGVIIANDMSGFKVGNAGNPYASTQTYNQYPSLQDSYFIGKGTLENVITGKGLVSSSSLSTVATSGSYNDLSNKPTIPDELKDLTDDSTHRLVTDTDKTNWNNKSDFSGNYNDLSNKPTIPTNDYLVNVGTSVDTDYRTNILNSKNLFNKNNIDVLLNYYVDNTGKITSGNGNKLCYIKLKPNTNYALSQTIVSNGNRRVGLFSSIPTANLQGTVLGTFSGTNPITQTITTTSTNIYLAWVYCYTSNMNNHTEDEMLSSVQLELNNEVTTFESYTQKTINVDNKKYSDTINVGSSIDTQNRVNVLYSHNIFSGYEEGYINSSNGADESGTGSRRSFYIPVKPGTNYIMKFPCIRFVEYDGNRSFIKCTFFTDSTSTQTVTVGSTTKYVRLGFGNSQSSKSLDDYIFNEGVTLLSPYEPYIIPSIIVDGEAIYNKPNVLWENSNVTTDFTSTEIQMPTDFTTAYKYYEVLFYSGTNKAMAFTTGKVIVGCGTNMSYDVGLENNASPSIRFRQTYYNSSTNKLTISSGNQKQYGGTANTGNNSICIPYQILGYK